MEVEPHQQNQLENGQQLNDDGANKNSFLCRTSSTRWTPATEQIRILKELYYNDGVRSPSADQIQKISAKLRQYGKIEGKNVFYWFQNHKARERQKRRLTTDVVVAPSMQKSGLWRPDDQSFYPTAAKYPNISPNACASGLSAASNQMGNCAYGSLAMEKSFRDCSLSNGFGGGIKPMTNNFPWTAVGPVDPMSASLYPFYDNNKASGFGEEEEEGEEEEKHVSEIETLPLFPLHGEDSGFNKQQPPNGNGYCSWDKYSNGGGGNMACSRASLELRLNSYTGSWTWSDN